MEGYPFDVHHPNRDQPAELFANQTELNLKFSTGTFQHEVVAGLELSREAIQRSGYLFNLPNGIARPIRAALPTQSLWPDRPNCGGEQDLRCNDRYDCRLLRRHGPSVEGVDREWRRSCR